MPLGFGLIMIKTCAQRELVVRRYAFALLVAASFPAYAQTASAPATPINSVAEPLKTVNPAPAAPRTAAGTPERAALATPVTLPAPAVATPKPAPPAPVAQVLTVIRGQLALTSGGRPLRAEESVDAVVYWRPQEPASVVVPETPYVISTERKTFIPRVLPIPVGASVRFPNNDPILHNVFSSTKEATFDLGLYGRSEGEAHRFTQPGVIRVYCNVHHAMVAHVLVMDTPFFTKPDAQGRFRLSNVPAGPGELFVWHERAQLWRKPMLAGTDADVSIPLELSKRRVLPHLNKQGQPYRRTRPDEY